MIKTELNDPGADHGFLDRGFKFTKGGGGVRLVNFTSKENTNFCFEILPEYLFFRKFSMKMKTFMSQRRVRAPSGSATAAFVLVVNVVFS